MKSLLMFMLLIIVPLNLTTAQVTQQWASYYNSPTNNNDVPVAMVLDNSGNIFVTGVSPTTTTGDDILTVKYNPSGVEQWTARYQSSGTQSDKVNGIAIDASGNVYVTGSTVLSNGGVMVTVKYNSSGVQQWAKQLGVPSASPAVPGRQKSPIGVDASGNVYVGGSRTFGGSNVGTMLVKYNSNGDTLWTRRYKGTQTLNGLGSAFQCIKLDGNFIYATGKSFDMNPNLTFATTIKYNSSGGVEWIRKDTLIGGSDEVIAIESDASGNIIVTCNYGYNIATFKYNSTGTLLWKKVYTGISGDYYDEVTGLALDQNGYIYLTGISRRTTLSGSEAFLALKYDPSGNQIWESFADGTGNEADISKGIAVDSSGNVYVTGISFDVPFNFNYMTVKFDATGVQKWKIIYDGGFTNRRDEPIAIAVDAGNNVIVTGISDRLASGDDYATIKYSQSVGVTQISQNIPDKFSLSQNYPNPFNPVTNIEFGIRKAGQVSLKIYDMLGKETATLVNGYLEAGTYKYNFDASGLNSGIYFYKISSGNGFENFTSVKKMIFLK
ncbi:MAG: SBBP repeat-containing protein [bacterium]